jgi:hypothetical protein
MIEQEAREAVITLMGHAPEIWSDAELERILDSYGAEAGGGSGVERDGDGIVCAIRPRRPQVGGRRMNKWQKILLVAYHIAVASVLVSNAMAR